ncbi:TIGR02444 family protein [Salinicola halophyticus]|uniref:TIGR02444 family protein n=1 Tax=Salinicola halophyticus TaxID=1808881 RepID=UPI0013007162|nr:TIGR02444 family protein [Salinicola halophyticus]
MSTPDAFPSLWSYALDRYARPGAETLCLTLQDAHGWDICELLWIAWLSEQRRRPDPDAADALADARAWQREMTVPLRKRRRALKSEARLQPRLEPLRQTLKQAELQAEREMLTRLEALPTLAGEPETGVELALRACRTLRDIDDDAYPVLRDLLACWLIDTSDAEPKSNC